MSKLKDWRKRNGVSVADLAERLGVQVQAVYRYESGLRTPEKDIMAKIPLVTNGDVQPNDFYPPADNENLVAAE